MCSASITPVMVDVLSAWSADEGEALELMDDGGTIGGADHPALKMSIGQGSLGRCALRLATSHLWLVGKYVTY